MVTDNIYQAMFLVHDTGVVLVDAPQTLAPVLTRAVAERTSKPITHVVYSHAHLDHIGGMAQVPRPPTIVAHAETKRLLERANDSRRPLPTVTFEDRRWEFPRGDCRLLPVANTTAELLAAYIGRRLKLALTHRCGLEDARLRVEVDECDGQIAVWEWRPS